jgi:hypothetical protein
MRKLWKRKPVEKLEVVFGPCCFCGHEIEANGPDPCTVTVTTAADKWQVWHAHGACFKKLLTDLEEAPGLFEPAHF